MEMLGLEISACRHSMGRQYRVTQAISYSCAAQGPALNSSQPQRIPGGKRLHDTRHTAADTSCSAAAVLAQAAVQAVQCGSQQPGSARCAHRLEPEADGEEKEEQVDGEGG